MYRPRHSESTSTSDSHRDDHRRRRGSTVKRSAFGKKSNQTQQKRQSGQAVSAVPKVRTIIEDDDDLNSGFGRYMRSGEGLEMMKLFILGNTLVIVVTFAWPHLHETFNFLRNWYSQSSA